MNDGFIRLGAATRPSMWRIAPLMQKKSAALPTKRLPTA